MATTKEFKIRITEQGAKKVQAEQKKIDNSFASIKKTVAALGITMAGVFSIRGAFSLVKSLKDTASQFEQLRVRLDSLYLSAERGGAAFDKFNKIAATTPYQVQNVVEAGATLKAFGVDAENNIKILADLAAFMKVDIVDAASAMGRAFAGGEGAADIFRDRGILNLIRMRTGIQSFEGDLEGFRKAMFKTFNDPASGIIGSTDKLARTVFGMESNMSDAFSRLQNQIGQKFAPGYKSALSGMITLTKTLTDMFKDLGNEAEAMVTKTAQSFAKVEKLADIKNVIDNLEALRDSLFTSTGFINKEAVGAVQFYAQNFAFLTNEQKQSIVTSKDAHELFRVLSGIVDDMNSKLEVALKNWKDFNIETDSVDVGLGQVIKNTRRLNFMTKEFAVTYQDLSDKFSTPVRWGPPPEAFNEWDRLKRQLDKLSDTIRIAFIEQFERGGGVLDNFVNAFSAAIQAMAAEILSRAAIWGIMSLIFGGPANPLGAFTSHIFGGFKAKGGPALPGHQYVMNEKSSGEVFVPNEPGRIEQQKNISLVIQTSDPKSFETWMRENDGGRMLQRLIAEA